VHALACSSSPSRIMVLRSCAVTWKLPSPMLAMTRLSFSAMPTCNSGFNAAEIFNATYLEL
jgi:hypothetical protein